MGVLDPVVRQAGRRQGVESPLGAGDALKEWILEELRKGFLKESLTNSLWDH